VGRVWAGSRDALGDRDHLGITNGEVLEEGVSSAKRWLRVRGWLWRTSSRWAHEAEHALEGEVGERQLCDPTMWHRRRRSERTA